MSIPALTLASFQNPWGSRVDVVFPTEIREIKGIGERRVPIVIRSVRLQVGSKVFPRIAWCHDRWQKGLS